MLQSGLENLPNQVAIIDESGMIVAVNQAWRTFADENHGVHPDHWVGENYFSVCERARDALGSQDIAGELKAVVAGDTDAYHYEYSCHSPTEQRWFRLDASRFSYGGDPYLLIVHTNITGQKLAELQATARTEQLETVIDVLRHDLRNPLNIIDGYIELLATELDDDAVETIRQAVTRISEITEATLEFSKSGTISELEPVAVAELARTAWLTVDTRDTRLHVESSQLVLGDRKLLLQLFENLYRNAVEHAGVDCTVRVGILRDGFYVEDDGLGIPEDVREKALRADYSTQGTGGLGLSIVQAVVRAHGANLHIVDAEGGGTRFELTGFDVPPEPTL